MVAVKNILIFFLFWTCKQTTLGQNDTLEHSRSKRIVPPLIVFPPTAPTRIQLIFGVGIPEGDLNFESLTNGWVLKYEYFLPSNATQLYIPSRLNISGRSIPDLNRRVEKYDVEAVQIDTGFDGSDPDSDNDSDYEEINTDFDELTEIRESEQKSLSKYRWAIYKALEAAVDRKNLVGRSCVLKGICEIARTPFHYQNGLLAELIHIILTPSASIDELSSHSDNEYFHAEVLGKSGAPCDAMFKDCKRSVLDIFTNVLEMSDDLMKGFV